MKRTWRKWQSKAGYIGIETIIVTGLMFALGAIAWQSFYDEGAVMIQHVNDATLGVLEITI